jgi:hypothetical protein
VLIAALTVAALLAGLAGAWSPCGFSMVETIAPSACGGRVRGTLAGAAAFALGALAGGVATFAGLAALGGQLGAGGGVAAAVAVAALLVAAAGDAAGRRIVPQVRRQVPESWRRILPLPLASGLYGVLLGLGFTTFVLSFATYALAAVCLALGDPAAGLAVGIAFGIGRALPVVLLAPLQDRDAGIRAACAMAERPGVLRGFRAAAAAGLAAAAITLVAGGGTAHAADLFAAGADPSAAPSAIAWQAPTGEGLVLRNGKVDRVPGRDPATGGRAIAWHDADRIFVAPIETLQPAGDVAAPGADAIAISDTRLVWRDRDATGRPRLLALDRIAGGAPAVVVRAPSATADLGRPSLDGNTLAFHLDTPRSSRIVLLDLATGSRHEIRAPAGTQLLQPSLHGGTLLYVRATAARQQLVSAGLDNRRRRILWSTTPTARRDAGHERGKVDHRQGYPGAKRPPKAKRPKAGVTVTLWTTALTADAALVTRLRHRPGAATESVIIRVAR